MDGEAKEVVGPFYSKDAAREECGHRNRRRVGSRWQWVIAQVGVIPRAKGYKEKVLYMTTKQVIAEIRKVMAKHKGSERDLYEQLCAEAEGWEMRLQELDEEESEDA
jgi:hypothetical protein